MIRAESQERTVSSFTPRPDAQEMNWSELLSPTRRAVEEVLGRLRSAVEARDNHGQVATTLLVEGERGSGKTTVLLCARRATEHPKAFFGDKRTDQSPGYDADDMSPSELRGSYLHKQIVWLDVLDLEPIPGKANLLTVLLVRIQNALERFSKNRTSSKRRTASLIEDATEDAMGKLDKLIRDATQMWEDVTEQSTRERAERHIRAAQFYADFQDDFRDAMKTVVSRLARLDGGDSEKVLVLPIDNVDRSAEHVKRLFQLIQMLECPHLWLVVAGDRIGVQTFLERAYHQELILENHLMESSHDEEQEHLIARRQAAATHRKVVPPLQLIKVGLVPPNEALAFKFDGKHSVRDLLREVHLPKPAEALRPATMGLDSPSAHAVELRPPETLLDLVDIDTRIFAKRTERIVAVSPRDAASNDFVGPDILLVCFEETATATDEKPRWSRPVLSTAGRHALTLPARTLVDLWLYLWYARSQRNAQNDGTMAITIVRTLLRLALNESDIDDEICKHLQSEVIHHDIDTMLNLMNTRLSASATRTRWAEFDISTAPCLTSSVIVRELVDVSVDVSFHEQGAENPSASRQLPLLVAGWLMLLYDILMLAKEPWVLISGEWPVRLDNMVTTRHRILLREVGFIDIDLPWRTPKFFSFLDADVFREQWQRWMRRFIDCDHSSPSPSLPALATAWIGCANSVLSSRHGGWFPPRVGGGEAESGAVLRHTAMMYEQHREQRMSMYPGVGTQATMVRDWLEGDVLSPLLPEFVGEPTYAGLMQPLLDVLQQRKKLEAGWVRFERVRSSVETALKRAMASRERPGDPTDAPTRAGRQLSVHIVGEPEPLTTGRLDLHAAASAIAEWLLSEGGAFHCAGLPEFDLEALVPEKSCVPEKS